MSIITSFPPLGRSDARVLILGSMPGVRSLRAGQYYAHKHNAFWPIMSELLRFARTADYELRSQALCERGVALWDVLKACFREGSMDADIRDAVANDFTTFLKQHPAIDTVFFNGAKAEQLWRKLVEPGLPEALLPGHLTRLPSTSPAYAAMKFSEKLKAWRAVADSLGV